MLNESKMLGSLASLGFLLSATSSMAVAQTPMAMPSHSSEQTSELRQIEQPLALKVGVTLGGLALLGLEVWWFLLSKPKSQPAQAHEGIQEMAITVEGGYEPSRVVVKAGQPVRLNFLRRDPNSCLEKVLLPDFQIAEYLPLNQTISVEFTPEKPGQYVFTCDMNMFRGVVEVRD
ncbi:cupredoxin domain-containing protein [Leptolyngbya sp. FACHB-261]|uniref:cupredoxin domain-containing protein n=1 Tax=Leptolyngbya sp. FACHB-261 TaxID=2692806 RepID=UPI0016881C3C|nr:cupredoxin domain-containing protein [Leptolyngbya sp. FACHB-261]MBD2103062.1 cupredoxin domain-containing protein [Leptolyngbya sp. FACHB-261]